LRADFADIERPRPRRALLVEYDHAVRRGRPRYRAPVIRAAGRIGRELARRPPFRIASARYVLPPT
jgi:hypothetical protein